MQLMIFMTFFWLTLSTEAKIVSVGNDNAKASEVVVFLHGFYGDAKETWTNADTNFFFPQELAKEPEFKNIPFLSYEYPAKCDGVAAFDAAKKLYADLKIKYPNLKNLSLVAHSFGGLIARDFIVNANDSLNIKILVNIAVPNLGSSLTNFRLFVKKYCDLTTLTCLSSERGAYIDKLNDDWIHHMEQIGSSRRPFPLCGLYETAPLVPLGIIVVKDSAISFSQNSIYIDADHSGIAKPINAKHDTYVYVKNQLLTKQCIPDGYATKQKEQHRNRASMKITKDITFMLKNYPRETTNFLTFFNGQRFISAQKSLVNIKDLGLQSMGSGMIKLLEKDYNGAMHFYQKAARENKKIQMQWDPEDLKGGAIKVEVIPAGSM